jgi:hypothetical protein
MDISLERWTKNGDMYCRKRDTNSLMVAQFDQPEDSLRGENDDSLYSRVYFPGYRGGLFICRSQSRFLLDSSPMPGEFCLVCSALCDCSSVESDLGSLQ